MRNKTEKHALRKVAVVASTTALALCLITTGILPAWVGQETAPTVAESRTVRRVASDEIDSHLRDFYDPDVVQPLSEEIGKDQELSYIVSVGEKTLLDEYNTKKVSKRYSSVGEFSISDEGAKISADIERANLRVQRALTRAGIPYELGASYNVLLGGFEIRATARYFDAISDVLSSEKATFMIGEEYERCETSVVTNDVNVHSTGIFDSSSSQYDGSGVVIAVLDTGLDYTHSAFAEERFTGTQVFTRENLEPKIANLTAAAIKPGLTAADVYYNKKIPFTFDYADGDSDVFPIHSEHGTHVSGIIVGKDDLATNPDGIVGVAPNAQLAFMKVFSDESDGARTSWIVSGLEDCVKLGVDVINMSLGSSCGFEREVDGDAKQIIYDKIAEQGISLVAAASNDYNSTFGSEKNGNLGLTSNPDSATVGSPSTYDAALSVASIGGVKTPYLTSSATGDEPIYLTEASGVGGTPKKFVDELLAAVGGTSQTLTYITIPGVGRSTDYNSVGDLINGNEHWIALVKRGSTNFEDKARIAREKGADGIIIYNNVSGDISMSVGSVDIGQPRPYPICSISQEDGERLSATASGTLVVDTEQVAGPFMSDFSSWGPTPSLGIKPEITAHGGEIYSAIPGQSYDRMSGTSMAAPNQTGVTALIRQYVNEAFKNENLSVSEKTARVNQIMMSTTDIALNKAGLPYSVRKQGAGLANLTKATTSPAYIRTYDKNGNLMDKTKLELGDDKDKSGVYTMEIEVVNYKSAALSYDVGAVVLTEGVSETLTSRGLTTVTEEGYALHPEISVSSSSGSVSGTLLTLGGNSTARVTVTIKLSDADKEYLDKSFANGMYVEGFAKLTAKSGTDIDLSVPYLAFYGDWTQAPLFDLDYFATNKDELDAGLDPDEKTMADAYATRPTGGTYDDYMTYLGSYVFSQNPTNTPISADRKYIALSNQASGAGSAVNSIRDIYAGMLRGAKKIELKVENAVTGEVIFFDDENNLNQNKSYSAGGGSPSPSFIEVGFNMSDYDLKNNTQYIFTMTGYLDYGDGGLETNLNNTFSFPFYVDFEAPVLTDVRFRTEYVKDTSSYRLYADMYVYDNHYSQAAIVGNIKENEPGSEYVYEIESFGRYVTPIYSDFNTTSVVTFELTDYLEQIKDSYNGNSFFVQLYDYAQNIATYEVTIPDDVTEIRFMKENAEGVKEEIEELTLRQNETFSLNEIVSVSPDFSWVSSLNYTVEQNPGEDIIRVINGKIVAANPGTATLIAKANSGDAEKSLRVTVTAEGAYDKPVADSFVLTGYTVNKVFYFMDPDARDLAAAEAGTTVDFTTSSPYLSMYPSESVTINTKLYAYFAEDTTIEFTSSNDRVVTVDDKGTIVAVGEGNASISVNVLLNGKRTYFSSSISIGVKNPFVASSIYLNNYFGNGGEVVIPDDLGITQINQFAFSNSNWIPKGEGDEISEEDPYLSKQWFIGENTITKIIVPEGVEVINQFAFAGLTALEEIVLPSTLTKVQNGAFYGCTSLSRVTFNGGKNNLQFINNQAFYNCPALFNFSFNSVIAIGDSAFENSGIMRVRLPATAQSIGANAFKGCENLDEASISAKRVKFGLGAFSECPSLTAFTVNASVVPAGLFEGDVRLTSVKLGEEVSVIGDGAFAGTNVSTFEIDQNNPYFRTSGDGSYIAEGDKLLLVAPALRNFSSNDIRTVGAAAFRGSTGIGTVNLPFATKVEPYAFAYCTSLTSVRLGQLESVGEYAFAYSSINTLPSFAGTLEEIGAHAFEGTALRTVSVPENVTVGESAFANCGSLTSVTIGNGAVIGESAFRADGSFGVNLNDGTAIPTESGSRYMYAKWHFDSSMNYLKVGNGVQIGANAFTGSALASVTMGDDVRIGDYAFYNCERLASVELSKVKSVGAYAFSGAKWQLYYSANSSAPFNPSGSDLEDFIRQNEFLRQHWGDKYVQTGVMTTVDLSAAEEIGEGAFAYCALKSVTLGDNLLSLGKEVFCNNTALTAVELGGITEIGENAFANDSLLGDADLANVSAIGDGAFLNCALTDITVKEGAKFGERAFRSNRSLAHVGNLDKATEIGARAFENTALTSADVSSATLLGDFAFGHSAVTSVTLNPALETIGENPFAGCKIEAFVKDGSKNYALGGSLQVIEGVLYRVAANGGLELITYPIAEAAQTYTAAAGTVRIGAQAFYGSEELVMVKLVRTVKAIGDKAFFGCGSLVLVEFTSPQAPILEEQYDIDYLNEEVDGIMNRYRRASLTGQIQIDEDLFVDGLGITPYYMWDWSSYGSYYYGGNFIDLIGEKALREHMLIMIRPSNGTGYDSFIYGQYFKTSADGAPAPTADADAVVALIKALPASAQMTKEDGAVIEAARAAYDALTDEQKALVQNWPDDKVNYLTLLVNAENDYLYKFPPEQGPSDPTPVEKEDRTVYTVAGVLGGIILLMLIGTVVYFCVKGAGKKSQEPEGTEEPSEGLSEGSSEEGIGESAETASQESEEPEAGASDPKEGDEN